MTNQIVQTNEGEELHNYILSQEISVSELSRLTKYSRNNLYLIFKREKMTDSMKMRIGKALNIEWVNGVIHEIRHIEKSGFKSKVRVVITVDFFGIPSQSFTDEIEAVVNKFGGKIKPVK